MDPVTLPTVMAPSWELVGPRLSPVAGAETSCRHQRRELLQLLLPSSVSHAWRAARVPSDCALRVVQEILDPWQPMSWLTRSGAHRRCDGAAASVVSSLRDRPPRGGGFRPIADDKQPRRATSVRPRPVPIAMTGNTGYFHFVTLEHRRVDNEEQGLRGMRSHVWPPHDRRPQIKRRRLRMSRKKWLGQGLRRPRPWRDPAGKVRIMAAVFALGAAVGAAGATAIGRRGQWAGDGPASTVDAAHQRGELLLGSTHDDGQAHDAAPLTA